MKWNWNDIIIIFIVRYSILDDMDSIIEKYNLQLQREKEELMAQYEGQMKENTEKIKQQK